LQELGPWPRVVALAGLSSVVGFVAALAAQEQRLLTGFLTREAENCRWVVFLNDAADAPALEKEIRTLPGVRAVDFVTKEQALQRAILNPALAEGAKLSARNPFPESFEVRWDAAFLRPDYLLPVSRQWERWDGVHSVGFDASRLDRVVLLVRLSAQRRVAAAALAWGAAALGVFLCGRWLFWRRRAAGRFPWMDPPIGAAMGAAGAGAVHLWLGGFFPHGPVAGAAVGLLSALGTAALSQGFKDAARSTGPMSRNVGGE